MMKNVSKQEIKESFISGIIATICGTLAVYLAHLGGVAFTTFTETLIAVIIACFFSGFFARLFVYLKK